ncbi:MAG: NAD-dependent epimerase/dehydratase family protein [Candidatus Omnitrophica bacterium]|nr:NAD-dependent epimerase/dehydratase family protein [Candidatus Omnitrophota bacterium]
MNVLVTGATGFIGRFLAEELVRRGYAVSCLVRPSSNTEYLRTLPVRLIQSDLTDRGALKRVRGRFDLIFHCAGYVGNSPRQRAFKGNVIGTDRVFRLADRLGVARVVHLSSVAVVSGNPQIPLTEDLPYAPTNYYGETKMQAEKIARWWRAAGIGVPILRPCMVYGRGEPHALPQLMWALRHRCFPLLEEGRYTFHLVYVKTVVDALLFLLDHPEYDQEEFFIADQEAYSHGEVMRIMAEAMGVPVPWRVPRCLTGAACRVPVLGRQLKFFLKDREYCTGKLLDCGFRYRFSARDALRETVVPA